MSKQGKQVLGFSLLAVLFSLVSVVCDGFPIVEVGLLITIYMLFIVILFSQLSIKTLEHRIHPLDR